MTSTPADSTRIDTVVLDLDGTLVDSVYVHVLAWQAACRDVGLTIPTPRLHRAIGMGGDRLVTEVAGAAAEESLGDELRDRHAQHFDRLFDLVVPTEGATELLEALQEHQLAVVLATSGQREQADRLLELVSGAGFLAETVTGSDAEKSKPAGELIEVALRSVRAESSVVIGDAVWDVRAAHDAGVPCIGLLTGGLCERELLDAGARSVFDSPLRVAEHLRETGALVSVERPNG